MTPSRSSALTFAAAAVLLGAAAYELAVALRWISIGGTSRQGPGGGGFVLAAAVAAILVGAGLCLAAAAGAVSSTSIALLPLTAVAFVAARFYSFDPYYAPSLRRMSDGGLVAPGFVFTLVAAAFVCAVVIALRPRIGLGVSVPVLVASALTALVEGAGH